MAANASNRFATSWTDAMVMLRADGHRVQLISSSAPVLIEGILKSGEPFYFSARWSAASLSVGGASPVTRGSWESQIQYLEEHYASYLSPAETVEAFRVLFGRYLASTRA